MASLPEEKGPRLSFRNKWRGMQAGERQVVADLARNPDPSADPELVRAAIGFGQVQRRYFYLGLVVTPVVAGVIAVLGGRGEKLWTVVSYIFLGCLMGVWYNARKLIRGERMNRAILNRRAK